MAEDIKNTSVRSDQFRFWGILSLYMGIFMIPSGLLGLLELTSDSMAFLGTGFFAIAFGLFLSPKTKFSSDLKARDGFIMVTCGWLIGSVWAALPYWFAGVVDTPVDAIFEAISGLTTTGATIFNDVESLPKSILLWRSVTQWLGGMGIILIAVAILPTLGAGGSQLFAAEVPGLSVERLSPRIATTARLLWVVYAVLTVLEALLLWRFGYGMGLFDAINHALTTMATGGFSTKNASAGAFGPLDQWIMIIFIFAAGTNFTLHYRALTGQPIFYWKSEEFRVYLGMIIVVTSIVTALLFMEGDRTFEHALRASAFQVVS
ncbi:MAG: TrkH family potassium uptake protein, partial [Candidatus Lindowbacteria bacterium]|nr:TrkH family potassium uptake protein [Candidatus Lindowbacteria bacterium]